MSRNSSDNLTNIGDLVPDQQNARKHNPRNIGMIATSLQDVGAARSIVIDEEGHILAGNGTVEAAAQVGIEKMLVVDADGETIVAVRRSGLTDEQKARLALFDNRTAELATWDTENLGAIAGQIDTSMMFSTAELAHLLGNPDAANDPDAEWDGMPAYENADLEAFRTIKVHFSDAEGVRQFVDLIQQRITEKTRFVWFPETIREDRMATAYGEDA